MKKALTKAVLLAVTLVILAAIIPLSANASTSNKNDIKTEIFAYLTDEMGLNSAAACGILANIEHESNFNPKLVIVDSNGRLSGGLFQWNGGRFSRLRSHCSDKGLSYLSVKGQLSYLTKELKGKGYSYIYDYLKNVPNSAKGAYDAAHFWCYYFEIPAQRSRKAVQRGNAAKSAYWSKYGNKKLSAAELEITDKDGKIDIDDSLTFKWTSAGKNADKYILTVAKKSAKTGKYNWNKAKTYNLSSSNLKKAIKSNTFTEGKYKAYITALNKATNNEKKSNSVTFTVECTTHDYESKITKQPTTVSVGRKTLKCSQCGDTKKEKIASFSLEDFSVRKVSNLKASSAKKNTVKLSWKTNSWATGYEVYMKKGNDWVKVKTLKSFDETSCTVKSLKSGKKYNFYVKAYLKADGKTVRSERSSIITVKVK